MKNQIFLKTNTNLFMDLDKQIEKQERPKKENADESKQRCGRKML